VRKAFKSFSHFYFFALTGHRIDRMRPVLFLFNRRFLKRDVLFNPLLSCVPAIFVSLSVYNCEDHRRPADSRMRLLRERRSQSCSRNWEHS